MYPTRKTKNLALRPAVIVAWIIVGTLSVEGLIRIIGRIRGIDYQTMRLELLNPSRLPPGIRLAGSRFPRLNPSASVIARTSDFSVEYAINSKGFRDREYEYRRTPQTVRILALGDSFTFGEGVPFGERFTDVAGRHFGNLEFINMGVPGYGIEHEFVQLHREGLRYSPDYVILFINRAQTRRWLKDFIRDGKPRIPMDWGDLRHSPPDETEETIYRKPDARVLLGSSRLSYFEIYNLIAYRRELRNLVKTSESVWKGKALAVGKDGASPEEEASPAIRDRAQLVMKNFLGLSRQKGFRLMVVNIDANYKLTYLKTGVPGLEYHDFSEALAEYAKGMPLRFTYDRHFNPGAHAFIGQRLIGILREAAPRLRLLDKKGR